MTPSHRLLRAHADDLPNARPHLSAKEQEREDRILATAQALMVRFGRGALTIGSFAIAMRTSPATIRKHFPDIDSILSEILLRHLMAISRAMGEAAQGQPDPGKARRAAYLAATRTALNAPTERHFLLLRERHALPPDLAETIEQLRTGIGEMLAGDLGAAALALLDTPELQGPQIEAMLATLGGSTETPKPAPITPARAAAKIHLLPPPITAAENPEEEADSEELPGEAPLARAREGPLH